MAFEKYNFSWFEGLNVSTVHGRNQIANVKNLCIVRHTLKERIYSIAFFCEYLQSFQAVFALSFRDGI